MKIQLTKKEFKLAEASARARNREFQEGGQKVGLEATGDHDIGMIIQSMAGELAFCKIFNIWPEFDVAHPYDCRVPAQYPSRPGYDSHYHSVDVKSCPPGRQLLICQQGKDPAYCQIFALMIGQDQSWEYCGWCWYWQLIQDQNIKDLTGEGNQGRPCYCLHRSKLKHSFPGSTI